MEMVETLIRLTLINWVIQSRATQTDGLASLRLLAHPPHGDSSGAHMGISKSNDGYQRR